MGVSYNRLWKFRTLEDIDRFHQKLVMILAGEFAETERDLATTIEKMGCCGSVTTDVLLRICEALDSNIEDIMEHVQIKETNERNGLL